MEKSEQNPKRWYLITLFCLLLSFVIFVAGPAYLGQAEVAHSIAIWVALGAPTSAVMGLRGELLARKN